MYCAKCGNEVEQHFRFCSRCGSALQTESIEKQNEEKMATHVTVLGWIFVGCGVLLGLVGLITILASQVLVRLPIEWPPDIPFGRGFLLGIGVAVGFGIIATAAAVAAAGAGLLYYRTWGRILAIIIATLMLLHFPIGTAIGIYALWVLLSAPGREHFSAHAALAAGQSG